MESNILKVGLDYAAPVPLHTDFASGNFVGFEVDLMNEIAKQSGLMLKYKVSYWKNIIADLQEGVTDVVCSAATITRERARTLTFSKPYLSFHLSMIYHRDHVLSWENCGDKRIGVREESEAKIFLQKKFPEAQLEISDTNDELYEKLRNRSIDALIDDSPIAFGFTRQDNTLVMGELLPETGSQYAIMMRKDNKELKNKIDKVLDQLEQNGFLQQIKEKWFGTARL